MRILGLDVGDKKIGVALSDPLGLTAQGIDTVKCTGEIKKDIEYILKIINLNEVEQIVVGLPKNMNGSIGPQAKKVIDFAEALGEKSNLPIIFWDERLTTVAAEKTLLAADVSRKKRKLVIDKIAATVILQSYLDNKN
ncbi:Holliday junction resolvase RuvX [Bacillota bacterium LX-D]|nr:Holliday junction resolvase RuvX [Bacillota bacterium LX-D]